MKIEFSSKLAARADKLFYSPTPQYGWNQIIQGVRVTFPDGSQERRDAVGVTFRAFHKLDKTLPGAKHHFDSFFLRNKNQVIDQLQASANRTELHSACETWRQKIVKELTNIKQNQLRAYGRTRKPIDLYIMNLVALSRELESLRAQLVPLLFLPLDGEMFQKAFTPQELHPYGLTERSKYGDVESEQVYLSLQNIADARAQSFGKQLDCRFHPIYLDLFWRDRTNGQGENLFTMSKMRD